MTKRLSFDEEKAMELYKQGLLDNQIAGELGAKVTAVSQWRYRRGLQRNLPPLKHGTRPEVTVEIPPGLKTVRERDAAEPTREDGHRREEEGSCERGGGQGPVSVRISYRGYNVEMTAPGPELACEAAMTLLATVRLLSGRESDGAEGMPATPSPLKF